jgi:hypothetical protein
MRFAVALIGVMIAFSARACDVCGCAVNTPNWMLLPQFYGHFIGLNNQFSQFQTSHLLNDGTRESSQEFFYGTDLRLRYRIRPRLMLLASVPFQFSNQKTETTSQNFGGIGDVSLMSTYVLIQRKDSMRSWKHDLQVSGGVKLPSGRYQQLSDNFILNPNLQAGTGSVAALLSLNYSLRNEKWTLQWLYSGRINGANPQRYKFGNRHGIQANAMRWIKWGSFSFIPQMGISFEMMDMDYHGIVKLDQSGGKQLLMPLGFFWQKGRYIVQAQYSQPLWLSNKAINLKTRMQLNIFYSF